jgi:hypothetical protein
MKQQQSKQPSSVLPPFDPNASALLVERGEHGHPPDIPDNSLYLDVYQEIEKKRQQRSGRRRGSIVTALTTHVSALLQDPKRLGRYVATGIQIGLIAYLAHAIWQVVVEITNEINQNSNYNMMDDHHHVSPPLVRNPQQIQQVLEFLEQEPDHIRQALQQAAAWKAQSTPSGTTTSTHPLKTKAPVTDPSSSLPPLSLVVLAQQLLQVGIPLRASQDSEINHHHLQDHFTLSVETIFMQLTRAEASLLQQCLWVPSPPASTDQDDNMWNHIAGLQDVKDRLHSMLSSIPNLTRSSTKKNSTQSSVSLHHDKFASLFTATSSPSSSASSASRLGVLLYGPPGCGKTLLVKTLAAQARLPCLVVTPSVLLRKYVGETNQQVRTLFSLANKLSPCILCIDELDGLFRERSRDEHEVSRDLKTEFLQFLDGMMTSTTPQTTTRPILVVGATNRPFDVDSAILRRLAQSHYVGLPDTHARHVLLVQSLHAVPTEPDLDLQLIVSKTEGYSPSDIRQVLQTAALSGPMRAHPGKDNDDEGSQRQRGLSTEDILQALEVIPPTPLSDMYRMQLSNFAKQSRASSSFPMSSSPYSSSQVYVDENGLGRWETMHGNFYNVGTIEIDSHTFDILSQVAEEFQHQEMDSDFSDDDEDSL